MLTRSQMVVLGSGALAGGLFLLALLGGAGGMLPLFLPAVPLSFCGLALSARHAFLASFLAFLSVSVVDPVYGWVFVMMLALPLLIWLRALLQYQDDKDAPQGKRWFPMLHAVAQLTTVAAALVYMLLHLLVTLGTGDLIGTMESAGKEMLQGNDPAMLMRLEDVLRHWVFLVFAMMGWVWAGGIFLLSYAVQRGVASADLALRPDFTFSDDPPPSWLPMVLLCVGLLAVAGSGNDRVAGECTGLVLLLPYLIYGLLSVHRRTAERPYRKWLLFFLYLFLFTQPFMPICLVAFGIFRHTEHLGGFLNNH